MKKVMLFIVFAVCISGCATTTIYKTDRLLNDRHVVVFLDGTANDQGSRTNVSRLFELTVNQNREDISAFYTEGVGSDWRIIGALTGWGIGKDVRDAYKFVADHYDNKYDRLYIFGFSRGAYAGRILSGLIFIAGIPDLTNLSSSEKEDFVEDIYAAYKGKNKPLDKRVQEIDEIYSEYGVNKIEDGKINVLGIWDTIEALGKPNYKEEINRPNSRYIDQICNIDEIFHAVALDDNRERMYTPILITGDHVNKHCPDINIDKIVEEVWFSGAHADLGGGYKEGGHLSGVSMNWMIKNVEKYGFLPDNASVYENPLAIIHDAEGANTAYKTAFKRTPRNIAKYLDKTKYNNGRLKIHKSAIKRIASGEGVGYDSKWYTQSGFGCCFVKNGLGYIRKENCIDEAP